MKLLREPLLHFFLIGAAIYGVYGLSATPVEEGDGDGRRIVVDQARVDSFIATWQARWSRPPTEQELDVRPAGSQSREIRQRWPRFCEKHSIWPRMS